MTNVIIVLLVYSSSIFLACNYNVDKKIVLFIIIVICVALTGTKVRLAL